MKKELHEILFIDNKFISNRFRDDFFKKNHPLLYNKIHSEIINDYSFKEKVYILYHKINNPICDVCNKKTKLISFSKGFSKYCSKQCIQKDEVVKNKVRETNLKKFGFDNPNKNSDIIKKRNQTIKNKYGVDNIFQSEEIKDKIKNTNLKRYGVEHNSHSEMVVNKRKKTFMEKYGVDNPNKNSNIIKKRNQTITLNYQKKYSIKLNLSEKDIVTSPNDNVTIRNLCPIHQTFKINKQNLFNRLRYKIENICTKCNPISDLITIKENEISDFIQTLNINYIKNDRKFLSGKEIDILMLDNSLGIEFNGLYWHSDKYRDSKYHLNKTEVCEQNNIQLLHIFEDEWFFKKNIVKSIIKSKLGIFNERIFARKCNVQLLNNNQLVNNFLENNHMQGKINSKINIGLFYNDELVSLMTFGKKRIALGNKKNLQDEYEMYRFCNKVNTQIVGGASKLFSFFIKTYNPKEIISFADRRYSKGNLYNKLNFELIKKTKPNYWYFKKNELIRYHRYKFRKDILIKEGFDSNMTEYEIMTERKYCRVYDCGNLKFVWVNKQK